MTTLRTQVGIVGAGPAGLLLARILHRHGIDSIVIDDRDRDAIEHTIRAGILEQGTVELLDAFVPGHRAHTHGYRHEGIDLHFEGESHRIDFDALVGRAVWLYPQHEVLKDLLAANDELGGEVLLETRCLGVEGLDSTEPRILAEQADGERVDIVCDVVIGADGSHGVVRKLVNEQAGRGYFREYPFAWFGILTQAPPSAPELIYSASSEGFALISQRNERIQRMYLQCDPQLSPEAMSDAEIWDALQSRTEGTTLNEGPIFQRDVLRFRSFVARQLRRGRVLLVGDAAHTVPPTGAKGMNLAAADVVLAARVLIALLQRGDDALIERFQRDASDRIWKAEHFSYWMTSMLHAAPEESDFDRERRMGELRLVTGSHAGSTFLAEAYTGWPLAGLDDIALP